MGISNDWQNINNLVYLAIQNSGGGTSYVLNKDSAEILAEAIGWETVEISNYTQTITENGTSIPTTNVWGIRPPADEDSEYNMCFFIGRIYTGYTGGFRAMVLSTGEVASVASSLGMPASVLLLRTTSTGCFAIRGSTQTNVSFMVDRFYNPKSDKSKWGIIYDTKFVDLYTGLNYTFTKNYLNVSGLIGNETLGQFVALKKVTVADSPGVYTSKTLYMSYVDYSIANKTIEIDSIRYRGIATSYWCFYIQLAE